MLLHDLLVGEKDSRYMKQIRRRTKDSDIAQCIDEFMDGRFTKEGAGKQFDPEQLVMGIEIEKEHSSSLAIAERIALDHLTEIKDYYTRLKKMEKEAGVKDSVDTISITVTLRDPEGSLMKFLKTLKAMANPGHSFEVIMDPDGDHTVSVGFDGDGAFHIEDIKESK